VLKIQSCCRLSILQEDCIQKNISVWGINILLRVIDLRKTEKGRVPIRTFLKQMRGKYCAQNSILLPPVNPTGRLYPEKYISLGHKHLARGYRVAEKGRVSIRTFFKHLREKYCAQIQSCCRLSILQEDCIQKNISV
jgi:hypothetical protein